MDNSTVIPDISVIVLCYKIGFLRASLLKILYLCLKRKL